MTVSATEQGERKNCFHIRPPLLFKFSMSLGGHYNHV